jgi:heat shock protein HslJ
MRGCVKLFYLLAVLPPLLAVAVFGCASMPKDAPGQEEWNSSVEEAPPVDPVAEAQTGAETGQPAPVVSSTAVYEELLNIVWLLIEIRLNHGKTELDRAAMAANGMGDIYTLQLTEEGVSGKAAPNRYFTTFELRYNHDFRLRPIVGTMLPANINVGGLMENEYYWYLQRANHWEIVNNALELYAYPSQNEQVVMRYLRQ